MQISKHAPRRVRILNVPTHGAHKTGNDKQACNDVHAAEARQINTQKRVALRDDSSAEKTAKFKSKLQPDAGLLSYS